MAGAMLSTEQVNRLLDAVDAEAAHRVLWHYGPRTGCMEPGNFYQALVNAIARADHVNRARLSLVFPGEVAAAELIQGHPDGVALLQERGGIAAT